MEADRARSPIFDRTVVETDSRSVLVLGVRGELDLAVVETFAAELRPERMAAAGAIVIDLTKVGFIDSSGLRVLLQGYRRLSEVGHRVLVVVAPGSVVERTLDLSAVAESLEIRPRRDAALADLGP